MRRILLATDFTSQADHALDRAVRLSSQTGATLDVLHAHPDDKADVSALHARLIADAHRAAKGAGADRVEIRSVVSVRDPREAILHRIERIPTDLVVLGGHGEPRFRDAIFGTTATHIVKHSPIPVLVVQTDPAVPYAKLMVAADRPEGAPYLVENALSIAPAAEVFTVHAFRAGFLDRLDDAEVMDDLAAREVAALQSALAHVAKTHPSALLGAHHHIVAEPGDAITVLMDETEQLVPDLVVMGTRHRDSFLGSRAVDACFWCPTDLLVVPEPEFARVPVDA
ncbi:universal stress protein [Allosphingosinicella sp.]|uniref:universal stress protein n=1 Tax=Allosphingosinicella sp. TaxID=2823234 RepID=UPI003783E4ED